ncbi:MAG: CotH kinase family protein [Verrucomicrobiales bacterium]|nr:CotH kinase family protein [Verrucomicrobiales bacterium]
MTWLVFTARADTAVGGRVAGAVFGLTNMYEIHLHFTATDWEALTPREPVERWGPIRPGEPGRATEPGRQEREYPWSVVRFEAGGEVMTNVAVRFKGNSSYAMSRAGWKRPMRLDFNRGAKGRVWLGAEELSLNNNVNDATQFREALAYEVYRRSGVPAPRTAFAKVRLSIEGEVTNHLAGVYTLVEVVEADFLKTHFKTAKGLLVKPERLRGLEYLGDDWSAYVARYDPKTDAKAEDTARFMALTRLIAEAGDAEFRQKLGGFLDLPGFLRFVAMTAWLGNYDSFVGNGHNYYLFQPRAGGVGTTFIPWDLNEAFGGHPGVGPRSRQSEFSILRPQAAPNRLIERVLAQSDWAKAYRQEVERLQAGVCETNQLIGLASQLADVVRPAMAGSSPLVEAAFRRVALGEADIGPARRGEEPRADFGRSGLGPPRGMDPARGEDGTLAGWIQARWQNVDGELAGTRTPVIPVLGPGLGGPGGPRGPRRPGEPRLGGPGGLVPPPRP